MDVSIVGTPWTISEVEQNTCICVKHILCGFVFLSGMVVSLCPGGLPLILFGIDDTTLHACSAGGAS